MSRLLTLVTGSTQLDTLWRVPARACSTANSCIEPCKVTMRGVTIEVAPGTRLRTAMLRSGMLTPHNGKSKLINCRGMGTCGTCTVEVVRGSLLPSEQNAKELIRLQLPPHSRSSENLGRLRLACQCEVHEDLELEKYEGMWGQQLENRCTEDAGQFCTYLGELEYMMDPQA